MAVLEFSLAPVVCPVSGPGEGFWTGLAVGKESSELLVVRVLWLVAVVSSGTKLEEVISVVSVASVSEVSPDWTILLVVDIADAVSPLRGVVNKGKDV